MDGQTFLLSFFLIILFLLGVKFSVLVAENQNMGIKSPILSSLPTFVMAIIITLSTCLFLSYSFDLIYALWNEKMTAISMLVITFIIIPVSFKAARLLS